MSNIPDFAMQAMEIVRQIEAQSSVTAEDWKDAVKDRYYTNYVEAYSQKIDLYIHGGSGIVGKGINDLLVFLDDNMQQMAQLTGISEDISFSFAAGSSYSGGVRDNFSRLIDVPHQNEVERRNGVIHNEYHERDYWDESNRGSRPGQYTSDEIQEIMRQRAYNTK